MQSTGLLAPDAVEKALVALRRFRQLCETIQVKKILAIATAACRDAENGPEFIAAAEQICGTSIDVLSGKREAMLSALGVVSGFHHADGIVGDLGGGSLELIDVRGRRIRAGATLPLGGLALQDISKKSLKYAEKVVIRELVRIPSLKIGAQRSFYAVGGTWRAIARLYMWQTGYPLHVARIGYSVPAREVLEFARLVRRVDANTLSKIEVVADAQHPLLAYAAIVLEQLVRKARPKQVVFSALGAARRSTLRVARRGRAEEGRAARCGS